MYHNPADAEQPYRDPTPLPDNIPKVQELGTSSAPLKSAAFFIGAYCKDYNGGSFACGRWRCEKEIGLCRDGVGWRGRSMLTILVWYRRLHALQVREPGSRTLPEGGPPRHTMCARPVRIGLTQFLSHPTSLFLRAYSIAKMRENCLQDFQKHWSCLEINNQVRGI